MMTLSMNDGLLHYGKKGMKWGVRNATNTAKNYIKSSAKSKAREYSWLKNAAKVKNTSKRELDNTLYRLRLENQLKANVKKDLIRRDRKKVYRNRANINNQNLKRITDRYKTENNIRKEVRKIITNDVNTYKDGRKNYKRIKKTIPKVASKAALAMA